MSYNAKFFQSFFYTTFYTYIHIHTSLITHTYVIHYNPTPKNDATQCKTVVMLSIM